MLPSLENQFIEDTFHGVLHTANISLSSTLTPIYDGDGNLSPLSMGNGQLKFGSMNFPTSPPPSNEPLGTNGIDIAFNNIFPVGSVYFTRTSTAPTFLRGTWVRIAEGRFIANVGGRITPGNNYGEYDHLLSVNEMAWHNHMLTTGLDNFGRMNSGYKEITGNGVPGAGNDWYPTRETGGGVAHNNTPPSFALYIWTRTA